MFNCLGVLVGWRFLQNLRKFFSRGESKILYVEFTHAHEALHGVARFSQHKHILNPHNYLMNSFLQLLFIFL